MLQLDHDQYKMPGEKRAEGVLLQSGQEGDGGTGSGQELPIGLAWLSPSITTSTHVSLLRVKRTHDRSLKRKAQSKREHMAIIPITPGLAIHSVVRMYENNQASPFHRSPDRIKGWVVKTLPNTASAHYQTSQMG